MKDTILILTGGGPAPGINTVIGTIAKCFIAHDYRVLGLHGGYKGLFGGEPDFEEIDFFLADMIFNRGGSYLRMSRYKPTDDDFENFNVEFFREKGIKLLVTIGGDDTATTADRVSRYLEERGLPIHNIHVPKTIDNDLPLPMNTPTFGFNSAKAEAAHIASTVCEDAKSSGNWFVISSMGRTAGHLALGIGASCHIPMIVIPEMFNKTQITLDKIIRLCISCIVKRRLSGQDYGAIIISEGVFHSFTKEEISQCGLHLSVDSHGHIELGKAPKAELFNGVLENKLAELKLGVRTRPIEIGYSTRCQDPIAYDLLYCTQLGCGVYDLFKQGYTGCMVYVDALGETRPIFLHDVIDPVTGKIPPRLVDINGDMAQSIITHLLSFITPADYEAASKYLPDPEHYDFYKILEWK